MILIIIISINFAMGLTDIDDKIIKKVKEISNSKICSNDDASKLSRKYEKDFFFKGSNPIRPGPDPAYIIMLHRYAQTLTPHLLKTSGSYICAN